MVDRWEEIKRRHFGGRRWIITVDVAAAATRAVERLRELGADDCFVIAGNPGTGAQPDLPADQIAMLEIGGGTMMSAIRAFYAALRDLPEAVVEQVDAWDPQRTALVYGSWLDVDGQIAGRPQFGGRPPAWAALEDKISILEIWQDAGIDHRPAAVVPLELESLESAANQLGGPVVVTADNHGGWHGGAEMSRIAWTQDDLALIIDDFREQALSVRVMPFVEGIPCSIHGTVFPDHVLTLRPVESMTFVQGRHFRYAGTASFWRPKEDVINAMRESAVRLGDHLRKTLGYRGTFTLDGVLGADGFMPTEVNPRFGVGLGVLTSVSDQSLSLVHKLLLADVEEDWKPRQLEAILLDDCAERGAGAGFMLISDQVDEDETVHLAFDDGWRVDPSGEDATMTRGPAGVGGIIRIIPDPDRTPFGPPFAPRLASGLELANDLWSLGSERLVPALDVSS